MIHQPSDHLYEPDQQQHFYGRTNTFCQQTSQSLIIGLDYSYNKISLHKVHTAEKINQ